MEIDKLTKWASALEEQVPKDRYRQKVWATEGFVENECGTTACAAGWAVVLFKDEGLRLGKSEETGSSLVPRFEDVSGGEAIGQFFGISYQEASYITNGGAETCPKAAAERIRRVRDGTAALCDCSICREA